MHTSWIGFRFAPTDSHSATIVTTFDGPHRLALLFRCRVKKLVRKRTSIPAYFFYSVDRSGRKPKREINSSSFTLNHGTNSLGCAPFREVPQALGLTHHSVQHLALRKRLAQRI